MDINKIINKFYKRKLEMYAMRRGGKLTFEDEKLFDHKRRHSLWYGGPFAQVEFPEHGITMCIDAIGDVRATLLAPDMKNELCYVKDKRNAGVFGEEMRFYLKDDDAILDAEAEGRLICEDNNWWEISVIDESGVWHDMMWCANGDFIDDAIKEAIDGVNDTLDWLHTDSITA